MDKPFKFCLRRSIAYARSVNDKIRWTSHSSFVHYHVAALQMTSNVHGEVDEVREDRLEEEESATDLEDYSF